MQACLHAQAELLFCKSSLLLARMTPVQGARQPATPVLPGLHAVAVQQEVQRLPVVEHLVAVMHDVGERAEQARQQQARKDEPDARVPALR